MKVGRLSTKVYTVKAYYCRYWLYITIPMSALRSPTLVTRVQLTAASWTPSSLYLSSNWQLAEARPFRTLASKDAENTSSPRQG